MERGTLFAKRTEGQGKHLWGCRISPVENKVFSMGLMMYGM